MTIYSTIDRMVFFVQKEQKGMNKREKERSNRRREVKKQTKGEWVKKIEKDNLSIV